MYPSARLAGLLEDYKLIIKEIIVTPDQVILPPKIADFLKRINIPSNIEDILKVGYGIMKSGKDPMHNHKHVDELVADLIEQIDKGFKIKSEELENLLIAFFWHDVWKSTVVAKGRWSFMVQQWLDGSGSAYVFQIYGSKFSKTLGHKRFHQIYTAIYQHSSMQILPRTSQLSQLLHYFDEIQMLNPHRYKYAYQKHSEDPSLGSFIVLDPKNRWFLHKFIASKKRRTTRMKNQMIKEKFASNIEALENFLIEFSLQEPVFPAYKTNVLSRILAIARRISI